MDTLSRFDRLGSLHDKMPDEGDARLFSITWEADYQVNALAEQLEESAKDMKRRMELLIWTLANNAEKGMDATHLINDLGEVGRVPWRDEDIWTEWESFDPDGTIRLCANCRQAAVGNVTSLMELLAGWDVVVEVDGDD
jgi:hypothetical protein